MQISDYWIVRRGHYRVKDLYTTDRQAWYWYTYGINFRSVLSLTVSALTLIPVCRAYAAYIAGILINVVGFAGASTSAVPSSCEPPLTNALVHAAGRTVPVAATHIYQMSFFTGFGVSALIYCGLSYAFPPAGAHAVFEEADVSDVEPCDEGLQDTASVDKKEAIYVSSEVAV